VAGFFIGRSAANEQIVNQLQIIVGPELGGFLEELARAMGTRASTGTLTILSIIGLLFGATGIFNQVRNSVNILWGLVARPPRGVRDFLHLLRSRTIPFLMIFLLGLLLSAAVLVDTVLGIVQNRLAGFFPELSQALPSLGAVVVPALTLVTFTICYKLLPDARLRWRDVWPGALLATLLFLLGRYFLMVFLERSGTGSVYGAAGSLVVLLVWVFFSANLLLLGAEFIKLYTARYGQPIRPGPSARFEGDPVFEKPTPSLDDLPPDKRVY
jgi:membrane protein